MDTSSIGQFIAEKRKVKGLTQQQFAERLGVTNKTVSRWENGNYMPDISLLIPICEILEVSLSELLQGRPQMKKDIDYSVNEAGETVYDITSLMKQYDRGKVSFDWETGLLTVSSQPQPEEPSQETRQLIEYADGIIRKKDMTKRTLELVLVFVPIVLIAVYIITSMIETSSISRHMMGLNIFYIVFAGIYLLGSYEKDRDKRYLELLFHAFMAFFTLLNMMFNTGYLYALVYSCYMIFIIVKFIESFRKKGRKLCLLAAAVLIAVNAFFFTTTQGAVRFFYLSSGHPKIAFREEPFKVLKIEPGSVIVDGATFYDYDLQGKVSGNIRVVKLLLLRIAYYYGFG
jgi:transcriptional regulator with XRE-family HTH domain